ncbi:type I CRISPR-associated protein Cas7 [Segatella hominis]|jgi:CRISPR-associated protein Csh2|uniref:type I CRISPR-associated protein Cas7 n=1 Tax=Segatella hominis TaxID=2518605 RepID=UPI0021C8968B|nr:type I CRISPR-associated protein Cas7 [Segatella hominis]
MKKSEILFLYETSYNIPNGDPFTGEQRYDEETKKILVSDVRIKRFIRTYLEDIEGEHIYVSENTGAGKTDSKGVLTWIAQKWNTNQETNIAEIMKELIDVRLFGGISTLKDDETKKIKVNKKECTNGHVQFTGPVQFAALNPSLNRVNLRMHQNTSHFTSKDENAQGAIATTTLVPYSVVQIHGWINPTVAKNTDLKEDDLKTMFKALWYGTGGEGSSFSRSKVGQDSLLLLVIDYKQDFDKLYGIDRTIKLKLNEGLKDEQIRSMDDYDFDFSKLQELAKNDKIEKIRFYTEIDKIKESLNSEKFEEMSL